MISRREFVKLGAAVGAGALLPLGMAEKVFGFSLAGQALPANPLLLTKYLDPLPTSLGVYSIPPSGPLEVGAYQFTASVHSQMAPTTVWGYRPQGWTQPVDSAGLPIPENTYLGRAFLATKGTPIAVKWHNNITTSHPLPVDPSLHMAQTDPTWAPPAGGYPAGYDYTMNRVPLVPHLHGGEVPPQIDGGPDSWWTAAWEADPTLTHMDGAIGPKFDISGEGPTGDHTLYTYPNIQPPATIWYHDHGLGVTRLNVYMGLAGAYIVTDPNTPGAEPAGLPSITQTDAFGNPLDIPLVLQDRMFDVNGQLYFPAVSLNPTINPFWVPEFFGDTMLVNGKVWPYLQVERRAYRFRILNGSNARFYTLTLVDPLKVVTAPAFQQIATDGGYLGKAAPTKQFTISPGERMEFIIDFSAVPAGTNFILKNGANAPFPAGKQPKWEATGQVMQFRVRGTTSTAFTMPATLNPMLPSYPTIPATPAPARVRSMTLNEYMGMGGPLMATVNNSKWPHEHMGMTMSPTTEFPKVGTTEIWEIINTTGDTHPIHTHLTQFQLISRQPFNISKYWPVYVAAFGGMDPTMMEPMGPPADYTTFGPNTAYAGSTGITPYTRKGISLSAAGPALGALPVVGGNPDVAPYLQNKPLYAGPSEQGWKDTVQMNPGEVTRILVRWAPIDTAAGVDASTLPNGGYPFDPTGEPGYVWHCHIIDHEDNEMMRPYEVAP